MRKLIIPVFCLFHLFAVCWWSLPRSFHSLVLEQAETNPAQAKIFEVISLDQFPWLIKLLETYIDLTGSQQYWDFFAPQSPQTHQYLSVCSGLLKQNEDGTIVCRNKPLFTNLPEDPGEFDSFGSGRSRYYRLTENLINRNDTRLLRRFAAKYYQAGQENNTALLAHRFELHPELNDLPKEGYRVDTVLLSLP